MKKLIITSLLLAGSFHAAAATANESGALPPAPMPQPGAVGPEHFSRVFVGETVIRNGQASLDIPLDAASNAYLVVFDEQPITARAPEANGRDRDLPNQPFRNPELESMGVPSVGARIDLASLPRGAHNVMLETARSSGPLKYAVLQPESSVEMSVQLAPLAARAGEPVTVRANLPGTSTANVNAIVRGAGKVSLRDDGTNADANANDGIYTGTFTAPRGKGLQEATVRVDADGQLQDGTPFRRTATAVAMVSHSNARFIADAVRVDSNALRIPLNGNRGSYRVEAVFGADEPGHRDADAHEAVAPAELPQHLVSERTEVLDRGADLRATAGTLEAQVTQPVAAQRDG
ncbi:MAG: hypothetical protein KY410_10250, partial [Proteobacteria bacterium]|nr:hypothetical protein [Pseudomonadota bacterium]